MHTLERKLKKAEAAYEREKSGANALALFARYVIAGKTIERDGVYLSKAFHVAVTAHKEDVLDLNVISAALYANILLENYESAYELIRQLESHGSFLSKSAPLFYGQVLYFNSIIQSKSEKERTAKKLQRNIETLYEKTEQAPLLAYLGSIQRLVYGDDVLCAKMYYEAYKKGLGSVFFFLDIYEILTGREIYSSEMNELAKGIIPWALNNDLPVDRLLERLEKRTLIGVLFSLGTGHLSKIYERYGHMGAFQCLCQKLIFENDTSERALTHYIRAVESDIRLRGLEQIAVKSAYENKRRDIPLSLLESALQDPSGHDINELAFLFGILAQKYMDTEYFVEQRENVVRFGMWALSKGLRGRDFNPIYRFLYDIHPEDGRLQEIVREGLFRYELEFPGVVPGYVCVCPYGKKGMYAYRVEDGKCAVDSAGEFVCYFMGEDAKEYISITDYRITKALENTGADLYERLYGAGCCDSDIIIALAAEYVDKPELSGAQVEYLQRAAGLPEISDALKNALCLRLAAHYSGLEQHSLAVHYYNIIGEKNLTPESVPCALATLVATGRMEEAASLIEKRWRELPKEVVFNALRVLREHADSLESAEICYNLILNGLCSAEILEIVFKSFRGTPDEWLKIANKIDSLGFDVTQIYEKIIINGIFTGSIGNDCNEAFLRLYNAGGNVSVIAKYAYFCCYEVIRRGKLLPDDIAEILEEIYRADDSDEILCYALALNYIRAGRQDRLTLISEAASLMEEEGLILPELKLCQDKCFISSYIEKNTPFVYYQAAHRNVFFRYKQENAASYSKKKMSYFRFGIYAVNIPLFHGETIIYYFEEENGRKTEPQTYKKTHMRIIEQFNDPFYKVNNAVIYKRMMKFDMVESLIEEELNAGERFPIIML